MSDKKPTAFERAQQEKQAGILQEFFLFLHTNRKSDDPDLISCSPWRRWLLLAAPQSRRFMLHALF